MGFLLDDYEKDFMSGIAREIINLSGTTIRHYSMQRSNMVIDPIYNEPVQGDWDYTVYEYRAYFEKGELSIEAEESGVVNVYDARSIVAKQEILDKQGQAPKIGDKIEVYGIFYDVVQVGKQGYINDTSEFVQYELLLKRNDTFKPERRE